MLGLGAASARDCQPTTAGLIAETLFALLPLRLGPAARVFFLLRSPGSRWVLRRLSGRAGAGFSSFRPSSC